MKEDCLYFYILFIINNFFALMLIHNFGISSFIFGVKIRTLFVGVIYKKINSLSLNSIDNFSKGKIINITAAELTNLELPFAYFSHVLLLPYLLWLSTFLL